MNKEIFKSVPEGWTEALVIEGGEWGCGSERSGLGIYITKKGQYAPGGVLKREDMVKLIKIFKKHLRQFPLTPEALPV